MRRLISILLLFLAGNAEAADGLQLASDWQAETVVKWEKVMPDMIVASKDGGTLFITNENGSGSDSPSLSRIDLASGEKQTLLYGLARADGLKIDGEGNLWLGEEVPDGLILRIGKPDTLAAGLLFDRNNLASGHRNIEVIDSAGRMAHEGLEFSQDGRYLYLADEWGKGCLFRLSLDQMSLAVFHEKRGWLTITSPERARRQATKLNAKPFDRIEDMERLPDGRILMAETGSGAILALDDRGEKPAVSRFFRHDELHHPDNLEWDNTRGALWITDDDSPSVLWLLAGETLSKIASHRFGEITGVESGDDGTIWFNLQHNRAGPDLTMRLTENREQ